MTNPTTECAHGRVSSLWCLVLLVTVGVTVPVVAQERSSHELIEEALLPAPPDLRDGATVVVYDADLNRTVLREGANGLICEPDAATPGFSVRCYPEVFRPSRESGYDLIALVEDSAERQRRAERRLKLLESGQLPTPPTGTVVYNLNGPDFVGALPLMIVFLPNATEASTGLPTKPSHYRPWLMLAGTPAAHIMIPGK